MSVRYNMGITVGGTAIPDPSSWEYEVADVDYNTTRDTTGTLHRNRLCVKTNYTFEWAVIDWQELQLILNAISPATFTLVAPDPTTYNTARTGTYYVGNRTGKTHLFWQQTNSTKAYYSLKVKFIEV